MSRFNCLMYHQIKENGDKYTLCEHGFLRHLDIINIQGYKAKSINDITTNEIENGVALTFDDGFKSDLWVGEKLVEYGYSATFYLVKDFIESNSSIYLNRQQVKQLANMGHEIGVHGKSHDAWTSKPKNMVLTELLETKSWLQDITGVNISSCAAPGGKINNEIIKEISENKQFKNVRNSVPWKNNINSFEVNATVILQEDSDTHFYKKLSGDIAYYNYLYAKHKIKASAKRLLRK